MFVSINAIGSKQHFIKSEEKQFLRFNALEELLVFVSLHVHIESHCSSCKITHFFHFHWKFNFTFEESLIYMQSQMEDYEKNRKI